MTKAVNIKRALILLGVTMALAILYYTNIIVKNLEIRKDK
jgi:hypothetical protein